MKKYYETLGLDMSASIEEVEQAYKELSDTWNPQTYQNLPRYRRKAEIKAKEINEAYERVSAFLLTGTPHKEQNEDQTDHIPPDRAPSESEPQTIPPQIDKPPQRKTLFYGLIVIALVLGALVIYQISDRKKPAQQSFQTAVNREKKPSPATESKPASTAPLQKKSGAEPAGEPAVQKYGVSTDTQKIASPVKIDYNAQLTEEALDKYNQDPERVKRAQKGLIANGYDTGPLDGIIGPQTTAALKQFASDHALKAEGLFASDLTDAVLVYAEVAATYPDWHPIMGSDDFAHWLDRQSYYQTSTIQNLKKSATAQQVIDILNRYKSDKN